ncbi:hypothetical protein PG993_008871 [Apiospora rasikravindrae]|uniref:Fungal N-terminal domain-containing protein n=1 Tax=Apiospora rasikravindrae TaxID=990691 RepID=A0ABR1SPK3_9PEZI
MEPTSVSAAFMATARLISIVIEFDHVPDDIKSYLDLVRQCHNDVQQLIESRNEHIDLLNQRPNDLTRVNSIIESAVRSLQNVAAIIEKSRPEACSGKTSFVKRFMWTYFDKGSFHRNLPLVTHNHNAVLSELGYVRQLGTMNPAGNTHGRQTRFGYVEDAQESQDMGLLIELLGGLSAPPNGMRSPVEVAERSTTLIRPRFTC